MQTRMIHLEITLALRREDESLGKVGAAVPMTSCPAALSWER